MVSEAAQIRTNLESKGSSSITLTDWSLVSMKGRASDDSRFYPSRIKKCIEQVVVEELKDKQYNPVHANDDVVHICNRIKGAVKGKERMTRSSKYPKL